MQFAKKDNHSVCTVLLIHSECTVSMQKIRPFIQIFCVKVGVCGQQTNGDEFSPPDEIGWRCV